MYNTHRGMVPAPNSRLTELLDQLRQEFESQTRNTGEFEHQCMCSVPSYSYPSPVFGLTAPLELFPSKCFIQASRLPIPPMTASPWDPTFAERLSN